jgi:hypothetical protein
MRNEGMEAGLRRKREALIKKAGHAFHMERPCYFNTGCCSFSDGDVTGIEIAEGYIRLVKWLNDAGRPNT